MSILPELFDLFFNNYNIHEAEGYDEQLSEAEEFLSLIEKIASPGILVGITAETLVSDYRERL